MLGVRANTTATELRGLERRLRDDGETVLRTVDVVILRPSRAATDGTNLARGVSCAKVVFVTIPIRAA